MREVGRTSKDMTSQKYPPQTSILKSKRFRGVDYDKILKSTRMYYERYADDYVSFYENWLKEEGPFSDPKYKNGYETVANLLADTVKPSEKVVNVGCGVGVWSNLMVKKGAYVVSLDNLLKMLQKSKERFEKFRLKTKTSLVVSDGFYLPFRDHVFDGATLNWVLAHIPTLLIEKFMNEISRVMKKRGWLFISDSYWRRQEGGKEQIQTRETESGKCKVYKYYYEPEELKGLIEKTFGKVEVLQPLTYELICIAKK
jgi:ubiquinone/menaquinone biosynthesis C-methylase UbiE